MTFRFKLLSLAAMAGAAVAAAALAADGMSPRIEWRIEDKRETAGEVDLQLTERRDRSVNSHGRSIPLAELQGLAPGQLGGPAAQLVRFRLTRDAGVFACEGSAQRGMGSGVCDFAPGRAFARQMSSAGMGEADDAQLLALAMADVGGAYLDELRRQRYAPPTVEGLVRAAQHGVNLRYLKGMDAAGYRLADLDGLITLRDHGVGPRYIEGLKAAGYSGLPVEQLRRLRDHGVSTDFIRAMADLGYRKLPPEELVRLRDHGVTARFVGELRELGYSELTPDQLVRLRDHGVTASFIRRANAEGARLDAAELVRRRAHGER